jgi:hypothetical protein
VRCFLNSHYDVARWVSDVLEMQWSLRVVSRSEVAMMSGKVPERLFFYTREAAKKRTLVNTPLDAALRQSPCNLRISPIKRLSRRPKLANYWAQQSRHMEIRHWCGNGVLTGQTVPVNLPPISCRKPQQV